MKNITTSFKEEIKLFGKQQKIQIIYGENVIESENINSINFYYKGDLLKSVMKGLNIDSNINIPKDTELSLKYGLLVSGEYEYIDYGKFIVYEIEKQEDTNSYNIICYDKLLYSMKPYEKMQIIYPITIRDYLTKICEHLNINFASANDIFVNYNKMIPTELYLDSNGADIGYTFRDVLDEIAQATASVICINNNDELEVRYINDTLDTIDEEYLKDINVNFGEKYGPINTIVLSRSAGSDNLYYPPVLPENPCEIKISDNQIMNFNNRDEFLPEIFNKLNGLQYYTNDFSSTGIMYYDLLDRYNVKIGENVYSCIMLNDECNITQGLEELIYTEKPKLSETDYTKADKTDRKINQTYLIVDKQNQQIEAVISQTTEQNEKINRVSQTVDELNSKISDIADITISAENNNAQIKLDNINQSEPIRIVVRPILENISYLYPHENLYPSSTLFSKVRTLRFENKKTEETFDYILPDNLLYYNSENYDEFILDYEAQTCLVNKRIGYNPDGSTYILDNPTTIEYEYPRILLTDGDYTITLLGYNMAYLFVRLMAQNIYTTQFATKAELSSEISQTSQSINLSVDQKLTNYSTTTEMNSAINITAQEISSEVSKKVGKNEVISSINQSAESVGINATKINLSANDILNLLAGNTINLASKNIRISSDHLEIGADGKLRIKGNNTSSDLFRVQSTSDGSFSYIQPIGAGYYNANTGSRIDVIASNSASIGIEDSNGYTSISGRGISADKVYQTSIAEKKKNFEKLENALDIIKKVDIYKYNMKTEKDGNKKHIGFVIGKDFKYTDELTSEENNAVDIYSLASTCLKAIQEQQEQIEYLIKEIKIKEK